MDSNAPTKSRSDQLSREIIHDLIVGDRFPVKDASAIEAVDGLQAVEAIHRGTDRPVVLHYAKWHQYRTDLSGDGADGFDIEDVERPVEGPLSSIIEGLLNGDCDPIDDADNLYSTDGLQAVEAVHSSGDSAVILHYTEYTQYRPATGDAKRTEEFDIYDDDLLPQQAPES